VRPPDERWSKMKAAWDACEAAGVEPPEDVEEFFDGEGPDPAGLVVDIGKAVGHVDTDDEQHYVADDEGGYYLIDLARLPKSITHIKVWMG
jgi:hypothetical protein